MYLPPFKTNKMLYCGLFCLALTLLLRFTLYKDSGYVIKEGEIVSFPIDYQYSIILDFFIYTFSWTVGTIFTPMGFYYALKEKSVNRRL